jgi:hypothetical protein
MTQQKQEPFGESFSWPVFIGIVVIAVLVVLGIYFFVYLRVGA